MEALSLIHIAWIELALQQIGVTPQKERDRSTANGDFRDARQAALLGTMNCGVGSYILRIASCVFITRGRFYV
jgi:hypothetical protein